VVEAMENEHEDIPVSALQTGDRILIRPGEQIPADGMVLEGASSVNDAFLTVESRPVPKEKGLRWSPGPSTARELL
jgi:P-type E1-E2 ATPase